MCAAEWCVCMLHSGCCYSLMQAVYGHTCQSAARCEIVKRCCVVVSLRCLTAICALSTHGPHTVQRPVLTTGIFTITYNLSRHRLDRRPPPRFGNVPKSTECLIFWFVIGGGTVVASSFLGIVDCHKTPLVV